MVFDLKQDFFFLHLFLQIDNSFGQIKPFTFNAAFGEETTQKEMFNECGIKHLVEMAVEGFVNNDQAVSSLKTGLQNNLIFFFKKKYNIFAQQEIYLSQTNGRDFIQALKK